MKLTCLVLLSLSTSCIFAQKIEKFYDFQWKQTDIAHARFYSITEHTDSGWHSTDYYIHDLSLQMEGWYEDSARKIASGKFIYAYPNKKVELMGHYLHGKKQGLWLTFHPNGLMADSTVYDNGNPVGTSLSWHANGYTADSSVLNPDGTGLSISWFDNGNPSSAGRMVHGLQKHGKWQFFHKNGKLSAIELYDNGKLVDKQYYDETGQAMADTSNKDRKAEYGGGITAWQKYLGNHLFWPPEYQITNSDMAAVVVAFHIDEDGKVADAYIRTPFYPQFDKVALNTIIHSPKWIPAMNHNRRVKDDMRQPVIFSQPE